MEEPKDPLGALISIPEGSDVLHTEDAVLPDDDPEAQPRENHDPEG